MKQEIFNRLDEFIKKFYQNVLIKRGLIFLATVGGLFLLLNFLEARLFLSTNFRLFLLIFFVIFTISMIYWAFFMPMSKIFGWSKVMAYKNAETLIKSSLPELKDHLRNLLELHEKAQIGGESENLILQAAIEQKISGLKFYNFVSTIDFRKNLKYARFAILPLMIIFALLVFRPQSLSSPTQRLIQFQTHFERPSPFALEILSKPLSVMQNGDFELKVRSVGDEIPGEVWLQIGDNQFRMSRQNRVEFTHLFRNVNQSFNFSLQIGDFRTVEYTLNVLPRPSIFDFRAFLTFPQHTGLSPETIENNGDFRVPQGTNIRFQIRMRHVDKLMFYVDNERIEPVSSDENTAVFSIRAMQSFDYVLIPTNQYALQFDTLRHTITVVPDQFPMISVREFRDTTMPMMVFFRGLISDDFGFSRFRKVIVTGAESQDTIERELFFNSEQTQQDFMTHINFAELFTGHGERAEYWFEVWDNDGINGPKMVRSSSFVFSTLTERELASAINRQGDEIQRQMQQNIQMLQRNQRDLTELTKRMIDRPNITWEERRMFEQIMQDQSRLRQETENLRNQMESMFQNEQRLTPEEERLLQKQRELNELLEQLFDEDMLRTLAEIQELMQQQMSREQLEQAINQIQMNNQELEQMLTQNLEIFRQMEVDRKFDLALDQLQNLREQQQQLREDIAENNVSQEQAERRQNEINEQFQDIQQTLDDAMRLNEQLQNPDDIRRNPELESQISEHLQGASQALSSGQNQNAQSNQSQAEQAMQQMQNELQQQLDDNESQNLAEDAAMIRRLLNMVVRTSFNQEEVMEVLRSIRLNDPRYQNVIHRQSELNRDISVISDSLYAIGTRQPQVAILINSEIRQMNNFSQQAMNELLGMNDVRFLRTARQNNPAISRQQYTMTSLNTMGLLLAQSLDNIESQMQNQRGGSCRNARRNQQQGGSCPSQNRRQNTQSAREMQEQLNRQLQQMREQMRDGMPQRRQGQQSMSEQLARSAAMQQEIRRLMQQAMEELSRSEGRAAGEELQQLLEEMQRTEQDLVNRIIDEQTLLRQEQILTRLLEHERAEMTREQEERRRGTEAQQQEFEIPPELLEYHRLRTQESELLQRFHPILRPFYQQRAQEFFRQTP